MKIIKIGGKKLEVKCRLKVILAEKDMRLTELANKTDLNYKYLSDVNVGRREPGVRNCLIIAKALDEKVEEIWKLKD